jgi:hypothetical protein
MSKASQGSVVRSEQEVVSQFKEGMAGWGYAVEAHRLAPPDQGFATRLAELAKGADAAARACKMADEAGFDWPPIRKPDSQPPYELRPGTGRRGPAALWERFDEAVTGLLVIVAGTDIRKVAVAYEAVAKAAKELAVAVASEDRANAARPRARARRSA